MRTSALSALVVFAATFAFERAAHAEDYQIDARRSHLVAKVFKGGVASGLAHDHIMRATQLSGEINFDPNKPEATAITLRFPTRSLVADEPEMRKKYQVPKEIGDGDRKKIQETMLGDEQLDAAKFGEISFRSKSVKKGDRADRLTVTGELTLHGKTREVTVPVETKIAGKEAHARGSFTIKQTDFDIKPYSAALGSIRNKDEVEIIFSVVAVPGKK